MMKKVILFFAVGFLFTGCGLYNNYEKTVQEPEGVFGATPDITLATSETSIAEMSWREFFSDPLLQQLIEQALANNTDLNSARINIEKSEGCVVGCGCVRFVEE